MLPATRPDRIPSEAPPSFAEVTTSCTWLELVEVKTFTNSGMSAPARVPQEMMEASFHHSVGSPARFWTIRKETRYVRAIETMEVIQTSEVNGASKSMSSEFAYLALAVLTFHRLKDQQ